MAYGRGRTERLKLACRITQTTKKIKKMKNPPNGGLSD